MPSRPPNTYQDAGVNIDAGDALVDWLQADSGTSSTKKQNVVEGIGGFASLYRLPLRDYRKPLLVTCTDGVGTKVKLAVQANSYKAVAQDCVAMCVNDLICTGGDPHLFLDYYACGELRLPAAQEFLQGLKEACQQSDCELVGGETAEMPGVYQPGDFDCAGFAVGLVEEEERLGPHKVLAGDQVIGISSQGFHSNGFSLLRKVFAPDMENWLPVLLKPTALYVRLLKAVRAQVDVHAVAHITGGGVENVPRVLPSHVQWKRKAWSIPDIFLEVQRRTQLTQEDLLRTLNCGVGLVLIQPAGNFPKIQKLANEFGHQALDLGVIQ